VTEVAVPAGLGPPLAVWDCRDPGISRLWPEGSKWAQANIRDAGSTYRLEFYLLDTPFAVAYRYVRNGAGFKTVRDGTGEPLCADPVVQMLDELPPAHLMAG